MLGRVVQVLGVDLEIRVRWRGEALDRLLDEVHALVVDEVVRLFRAAGWEVPVEAAFSIWGERGRIDVLAYHPGRQALAVGEVKSTIADSQDTIGDLDRKARLAPQVAMERGWRPAFVSPAVRGGDAHVTPSGECAGVYIRLGVPGTRAGGQAVVARSAGVDLRADVRVI